MRRTPYKKYFLLVVVLFALMSMPIILVERIQVSFISLFTPLWKLGAHLNFPWNTKIKKIENECSCLKSENHLQKLEISKLKNLFDGKTFLEDSGFLLGLKTRAVPASIIYRDPSSWTSSFWVSVGEENNQLLKKKVIAKNSPVLLGNSVVGLIDYVGERQSRVRLITDSALKPSVRAARGHPQDLVLQANIQSILISLTARDNLPLSLEDKKLLIFKLKNLKNQLAEKNQACYLAKGILQGVGNPLWKKGGATLKGTGFNYDFDDETGCARDLLTGSLCHDGSEPLPLLKVDDLLVTTGMDGVFPKGLWVAKVTRVYPIKEGGYTYEIEAEPTAGSFDELETVFIIPPLGYEELK
jgi:rod shape-determining protein MreC